MPEKPSFPIIMFMVAFIKDFLFDLIIFALTIIILPLGWIFGILIGLIYGGIFWLWFIFKPSAVRNQKLAIRFAVRWAIMILISWIPLVRLIVPEMTLLVWFTYRAEVKSWKEAREEARRSLRRLQRTSVYDLQKERLRQRREVRRIMERQELLAEAA